MDNRETEFEVFTQVVRVDPQNFHYFFKINFLAFLDNIFLEFSQ